MSLRSALMGLATFGTVAMAASAASAAIPNGLPSPNQPTQVDQVRYVCNAWGRCWWRPNYYYPGPRFYYGPRPFYGPRYYGGWHRGWGGPRYYGGWHHRRW